MDFQVSEPRVAGTEHIDTHRPSLSIFSPNQSVGSSSWVTWPLLSQGMWNLLGPGIKPVSPALAGGFLTTGSPEKSLSFTLTTELCPPVNSLRRLVPICDCAPAGRPIPQRLQVRNWIESLLDPGLRCLHPATPIWVPADSAPTPRGIPRCTVTDLPPR